MPAAASSGSVSSKIRPFESASVSMATARILLDCGVALLGRRGKLREVAEPCERDLQRSRVDDVRAGERDEPHVLEAGPLQLRVDRLVIGERRDAVLLARLEEHRHELERGRDVELRRRVDERRLVDAGEIDADDLAALL